MTSNMNQHRSRLVQTWVHDESSMKHIETTTDLTHEVADKHSDQCRKLQPHIVIIGHIKWHVKGIEARFAEFAGHKEVTLTFCSSVTKPGIF